MVGTSELNMAGPRPGRQVLRLPRISKHSPDTARVPHQIGDVHDVGDDEGESLEAVHDAAAREEDRQAGRCNEDHHGDVWVLISRHSR